MNFYENEALEQRMEELSDQLGYLVRVDLFRLQ